jgi:hypothetical protein
MDFVHVRLSVERGSVRAVREATEGRWGLFAPQIGDTSETLVLIAPEPNWRQSRVADAPYCLQKDEDGITATVRPTSTEPLPPDDGVYAHRWFDIDPAEWDEFLALSEGAWPGFEAASPGVRIHGFFRAGEQGERVLLVTRYPSLAAWETSRNAPDEAGGANFRRRHELTRSTIVRTYRLIA